MTNTPEYLQNRDLKLILLGGKGGVGKTTFAASAAVYLARSNHNNKVLVISTDPAHSLSDSFGIEIGDKITPIQWSEGKGLSQRSEVGGRSMAQSAKGIAQRAEVGGQRSEVGDRRSEIRGQKSMINAHDLKSEIKSNLFARELDAPRLAEVFKRKHEAVLKKLADRGTYFDQADIAEFFNLSLPGMDEIMAIIEIANILKEGNYDILILDTAPTGHTVRMLTLPEKMQKWVEVMDLMQQKHRYMASHFTGKKYVKDACDIFLDNLSTDIQRVKRMLTDEQTTLFVPVTILEPMSTYETKKLVSTLETNNIPVTDIIVNKVVETDGCVFCTSRKNDQREAWSEIEDVFSRYNLIRVPLFPREIRGVERLTQLADYFLGKSISNEIPKPVRSNEENRTVLSLNSDMEFILFGGKGGVGKTSLASAFSLHLARCHPEKKVFIFSTDPAHSLSDSFKLSIGDKITPIHSPTNLFALEIEADKLFEDFKQAFKKDIEKLFDKFLGSGVDIKFDREVMTELLTLAPPGLDEIMALDKIMELRDEKKFDIFVLDTSPTGHLLRFMELPNLVKQWLRTFFRLLLKYRGVVRLAKIAEKALVLSKNVRRIQEDFTDDKRTNFVSVTIPETMGFQELNRLMSALDQAKVPCHHIVINMAVPHTDCSFCLSKRMEQQEYINKIHSTYPTHMITEVPLFPHDVRGLDDLNRIGEIAFGV